MASYTEEVLTAEEQRLVNEAFIAARRVVDGCPAMPKYARQAVDACGDLIAYWATVPEPDVPGPQAQVLRLVR